MATKLKIKETDLTLVGVAEALPEIATQDQYTQAADVGRQLKSLEKVIKDHYAPLKRKAQETHKAIVAAERGQLAPVYNQLGKVKRLMLDWNAAQEQARRAEAEAEAKRIDEETQRQAALQAEELDRRGRTAEADEVITTAFEQNAVVIPTKAAKADGIAMTYNYNFEVFNDAVVPRSYLEVSRTAVMAAIRGSDGTVVIPGIKIIKTPSLKITGA